MGANPRIVTGQQAEREGEVEGEGSRAVGFAGGGAGEAENGEAEEQVPETGGGVGGRDG